MARTYTSHQIYSSSVEKLVEGTRGSWNFVFTYDDMVKATGISYDHLCKQRERKRFHPDNPESIFLYFSRYGKHKAKVELLEIMLGGNKTKPEAPHNLESFVRWMARYAKDTIKARAIKMMLQHELGELPGAKARPGKHRTNGQS
jgi:hypothetical protein